MAKGAEKPPIRPLSAQQSVRRGVPDEYWGLIGRVIVQWGWLEACMQDLLWSLVGVPIEDGRVMTQRADVNRKMQWIRVFAHRRITDQIELKKMIAVLDEIQILQSDRNFVAR